MVSQDVKANTPVGVDVRVIDLGCETDFRRLKRIVGREGDRKEEDAPSVWRVALKNVE